VVADHHGHLDARSSDPELVENVLVRLDYVLKLLGSMHASQLPEPERIAHDKQFGLRVFVFQSLQEGDELCGIVAMLQAAITAHVKVADKVVLLRQMRPPCRTCSTPLVGIKETLARTNRG